MKTAEEILQIELDKEGIIYVCDEHEDYIGDQDYAFSQALSAMHEYAEQFKPKWIPLTDRYPTINTPVLVALKGIKSGKNIFKVDEYIDKEWRYTLPNCITHWMPLPEAP